MLVHELRDALCAFDEEAEVVLDTGSVDGALLLRGVEPGFVGEVGMGDRGLILRMSAGDDGEPVVVLHARE